MAAHWFDIVQSIGIISSLLLGGWMARRSFQANRVSNYLLLTQYHREIWSLTLNTEKYDSITSAKKELWHQPITNDESIFLTFVFLHVSCAYELSRTSSLIQIENVAEDLRGLLIAPKARRHWEETKRFHNASFVRFVDSCTPDTSRI